MKPTDSHTSFLKITKAGGGTCCRPQHNLFIRILSQKFIEVFTLNLFWNSCNNVNGEFMFTIANEGLAMNYRSRPSKYALSSEVSLNNARPVNRSTCQGFGHPWNPSKWTLELLTEEL